MGKQWFDGYGYLTWLDPQEYIDGDWWYVKTVILEELVVDIVRNTDGTDYHYTTI